MRIKIGDKQVGKDDPCFIIAEAGVNHNGDISLAKKLVDAAKDADADAIKFQTFRAENVVIDGVEVAEYAKENTKKNIEQQDLIKSLELEYDDFITLKEYSDDKGIIFLSTPHSFDAIDFLEKLVPAYKIGSGDLTNLPALKYTAKKNKPIILGTGMSSLSEVEQAVNAIRSENNNKIIALHCTTNYPCSIEDVNLRAMKTIQEKLDCLIGYSDHSQSLLVPVMAVAMGANVIEKHFTIDKNLSGPDHKASFNTTELQNMVIQIRDAEKILGDFEKKPTVSEKEIMKLVRKSIVSVMDISEGTTITSDMISIKRPGSGINPKFFDDVVGMKAKVDIKKESLILKEMIQ